MLVPGQTAPAFELPDADMRLWSSDALRGQSLVLFFYPKDNTPGCTLEALEFSDQGEAFGATGCLIFGISRDDCVSHANFRDEHGISVTLLADIDGQATEAYGVWQTRERNGERHQSIIRSTFIIDKAGLLRHALYQVKPRGHAAEVLTLVKAL